MLTFFDYEATDNNGRPATLRMWYWGDEFLTAYQWAGRVLNVLWPAKHQQWGWFSEPLSQAPPGTTGSKCLSSALRL